MFKRIRNFIVDAVHAGINTVKSFVKGLIRHAETVAILVLATIGLAGLLAEVLVFAVLPAVVEAAFIIPVAAVIGILGLLKTAEFRTRRGLYLK